MWANNKCPDPEEENIKRKKTINGTKREARKKEKTTEKEEATNHFFQRLVYQLACWEA